MDPVRTKVAQTLGDLLLSNLEMGAMLETLTDEKNKLQTKLDAALTELKSPRPGTDHGKNSMSPKS